MKNRSILFASAALFLGLAMQAQAYSGLDVLTLPLRLPFILASHGILPPVPVVARVRPVPAYVPAVYHPAACAVPVARPLVYRSTWHPGAYPRYDHLRLERRDGHFDRAEFHDGRHYRD